MQYLYLIGRLKLHNVAAFFKTQIFRIKSQIVSLFRAYVNSLLHRQLAQNTLIIRSLYHLEVSEIVLISSLILSCTKYKIKVFFAHLNSKHAI